MSSALNSHRKTESVSSVNSNLLAEQFERDRKSIIFYCFTKHGLDDQGAPIHQYYTHVRVIEDQAYNNSKPPANYHSVLTNKKKRILVISYNKQTKEPQIHKARENSDGSIQIGRTWLLKELKQVINNLDNKEGFLLNMNKLYYWETKSGRERTAFIKTLVKIFMDHFANHVPELIDWDLGMWYLNENSYERAVIREPLPASSKKTGLKSQPIVNQRVTSNLPVQDKLTGAQKKPIQQINNATDYNRTSPSVQGKPQFETIQENSNLNPTLTKKDNTLYEIKHSQVESDNQKTFNSTKLDAEKESMPKPKLKEADLNPAVEKSNNTINFTIPAVTVVEKSKEMVGLSQPKGIQKNTNRQLVDDSDYFEADSSTQHLQFISEMNSSNKVFKEIENKSPTKEAFEKIENKSPTKNVSREMENTSQTKDVVREMESKFSAKKVVRDVVNKSPNKSTVLTPSTDLEKSLEEELLKMNQTPVKGFQSPVQPIQREEIFKDDDHFFLDSKYEDEPIAFDDIEKETSSSTQSVKDEIIETGHDEEDIDEEALLQIVDSINWSKNDDMRTLVDKFESKYLEVAKVYNENLIRICNEYDSDNKTTKMAKVATSIKENYGNIEKVQVLFQTELKKYENETYSLMKCDDNIQITSSNKKQIIKSLKTVIDDVSLDSSELSLLKTIKISTEKLYEIEPILERLSIALLVIRGASQKIKVENFDETWAYNLAEIREKRDLYENSCKSFIDKFEVFFENTLLARLKTKLSLSELSNIIPYNGILLFIKLVAGKDFEKLLTSFDLCMGKVYGKLIDDHLFDLKELINPRRVTIVNNNNNTNSPVQPLFSSSSNGQAYHEIMSTASNQSSTIAASLSTSSMHLLEFKNLESLLQTWQYSNSTKKIDILKHYKDPSVLLKVLKAISFLKSLPLTYQNFLGIFFHINDEESSTSMNAFLKEFKVPSQRIRNLNESMTSTAQQKNSTLEWKWNLCSDMFNFKLSNFFAVITNLLKVKHGHLLNSLMLFVENELLQCSNNKEKHDFLFIQSHLKKLLYKIKTDLEELVQVKSIVLDKFKLSITKDNVGTCSQKLTTIVQDFIMYFYSVKQDTSFLIENLPIDNFKAHNWDTMKTIENNYLKLSTLISNSFTLITSLSKEKNDVLAVSTNTLVTENDKNIESIVNMNFLDNFCIDFLPLLNNEKLTSSLLAQVKKQNNDFFRLNLSEILIKDNLLKLYIFVKSAWAIVNSNNSNENDPSKYVAYSANNLNQILVDYDTDLVLKIIENIYQELSQYMNLLEKVMISQLQDPQSKNNLSLVSDYIQQFKSKVWSNIQGDFVSFFLKLYSLLDKYYSKGSNKIDSALKFNKNDIIQGFMKFKN